MRRLLVTALLTASATAQFGVLDQDNTVRDNVSWNMGYFADHQQEVPVTIGGQLTGFTIRLASQNLSQGLPVALFLGLGPHPVTATPLWTGTAHVTITNLLQTVFVDTSAANLIVQPNDVLVIRCGDGMTPTAGVDLVGNSGWPNPFYTPSFYESGVLRSLDRLYFQSFVLPCGTAAVATYGRGCVGTAGRIPTLLPNGCPVPGQTFGVDLANGLPNASALLLFGTGQLNLPLGPHCDLDVLPLIPVSVPLTLSSQGQATFGGIMPPARPGTNFTMQAFVLDAGSPIALAGTNALLVVTG